MKLVWLDVFFNNLFIFIDTFISCQLHKNTKSSYLILNNAHIKCMKNCREFAVFETRICNKNL